MENKNYCNKCNKAIPNLNDLEKAELKKEGSFVCSECINNEMDDHDKMKERNMLFGQGSLFNAIKTNDKEQIKDIEKRAEKGEIIRLI